MKSSKLKILIEHIVKTILLESNYEVDEMSTAAGAGPVTGKFNGKKKVMEGDEADAVTDMWAGSDDDLASYGMKPFKSRPPAKKPISKSSSLTSPASKKGKIVVNGKEIRLSEMTTTGDVAGYNVPSAFSKRGGSQRGLEGSESLGYTLTSIGDKEMKRGADKLI